MTSTHTRDEAIAIIKAKMAEKQVVGGTYCVATSTRLLHRAGAEISEEFKAIPNGRCAVGWLLTAEQAKAIQDRPNEATIGYKRAKELIADGDLVISDMDPRDAAIWLTEVQRAVDIDQHNRYPETFMRKLEGPPRQEV